MLQHSQRKLSEWRMWKRKLEVEAAKIHGFQADVEAAAEAEAAKAAAYPMIPHSGSLEPRLGKIFCISFPAGEVE